MLHGLGQRLRTVTGVLPAVERFSAALHAHAAAAEEGAARIDESFLQRHGERDDLEGRAGLVGIGDGLVAPLGLLGRRETLRRLVLVGHGADLGADVLGDLLVAVEIEVSERGHGQDRAGPRVHQDPRRAVLHVVVPDGLPELLFQKVLQVGVDGEVDAVPVLGVHIVLVARQQQIRPDGVFQTQDAPVGAGELVVVCIFHPGEARVVHAHEADQVGGKVGIGIVPLGVRFELHALQIVPGLEGADLGGPVPVDLPRHGLVPGAPVAGHTEDPFPVLAEDAGEPRGDQLRVLPVHGDLRRGEIHREGGGADGQHPAVDVIDRAAARRDRRAPELLAQGGALELVVAEDLQPEQLGDQDGKGKDAAHCR